jgi:hypothetical protein
VHAGYHLRWAHASLLRGSISHFLPLKSVYELAYSRYLPVSVLLQRPPWVCRYMLRTTGGRTTRRLSMSEFVRHVPSYLRKYTASYPMWLESLSPLRSQAKFAHVFFLW